MNRQRIIENGWHADATPRGSWAVMMPLDKRLNTSRGPVERPLDQHVLFVVCADVVDDAGVEYFCIAGQGHHDDLAWLWVSDGAAATGQWYALCPSYGTSPCAFAPDGRLYISTPGTMHNIRVFDPLIRLESAARTQPVGVRGIAAVSQGPIIHGPAGWTTRDTIHGQDAWYGRYGLGEYVEVGPYAIGQGIIADGLVAAGFGKLILDGLCQFCRVHLIGEQFAIAVWQPGFAQAVLLWPTVADLQTLPPDVAAPMPIPPDTPAPPSPEPVPAPPPVPVPPPSTEPWPYPPATPYEVVMPKIVVFRLGKFYARVDPAESGQAPWPGWRRVLFDRTDASDPNSKFTLTQPDAKFKAQHVATGGLLCMDFTEHGGGVCNGFYLKPTDERGNYESLSGWQLGSGGINVVLVEWHDADGTRWASPCLTVVEL